MDETKFIFGRRLRLLRKMRGLTLERLGRAASIGFKHIAELEKGAKAPSFEAIDRLSKALKVPPYELFLPFDSDEADIDTAFRQLTRQLESEGSRPLKRFLLVALPLLRQFESDAST